MAVNHLLLPNIDIKPEYILPKEYKVWLEKYLENIHFELTFNSISLSDVVNGLLIELILYNETHTDWLTITNELLEIDDLPINYSEEYGKKLHKFSAQWKQTDIITLYNHKFIMEFYNKANINYESLILNFTQINGYIYNPDVSNTNPRTRMKSEVLMSLAMSTEIIDINNLKPHTKNLIESFDNTDFIASEYFKNKTFDNLNLVFNENKKQNLNAHHKILLEKCYLQPGFADFSVDDKIDDYMGTAKRIGRDKAVASPLSTLYAYELAKKLDSQYLTDFNIKKEEYLTFLEQSPLNIKAYKMRDLDTDFGSSLTPFEIFSYYILKNT